MAAAVSSRVPPRFSRQNARSISSKLFRKKFHQKLIVSFGEPLQALLAKFARFAVQTFSQKVLKGIAFSSLGVFIKEENKTL